MRIVAGWNRTKLDYRNDKCERWKKNRRNEEPYVEDATRSFLLSSLFALVCHMARNNRASSTDAAPSSRFLHPPAWIPSENFDCQHLSPPPRNNLKPDFSSFLFPRARYDAVYLYASYQDSVEQRSERSLLSVDSSFPDSSIEPKISTTRSLKRRSVSFFFTKERFTQSKSPSTFLSYSKVVGRTIRRGTEDFPSSIIYSCVGRRKKGNFLTSL